MERTSFAAGGWWRGRGILEGPGTNTLRASISKTFVVKERIRLRLEGLATNLFNKPNYQNPILHITEALTRVQISPSHWG